MKHVRISVLLFTVTLFLSACGGGAADEPSAADAVLTQAAQLAIEALTQNAAAASPTSTATATSTSTPTTNPSLIPTNALSGLLTTTPGTPGSAQPTQGGPAATATATTFSLPTATTTTGGNQPGCYTATFEGIETIPDGTSFPYGKKFTKMWRVKNTGTCPWTAAVELIWVNSEINGVVDVTTLGAPSAIQIITDDDVLPGEYINIEVEFTAPTSKPGTYKVYWMFRGPNGVFGVNGGGALWVLVNIFDPD